MKNHNLDASNQIVGRLATRIANLLMGKANPNFLPYLDKGDTVTISNADKVRFTGKKWLQKIYTNFSGYPGGLNKITAVDLNKKRPSEIIRRAVYNMLPKNKLRATRIKRLRFI